MKWKERASGVLKSLGERYDGWLGWGDVRVSASAFVREIPLLLLFDGNVCEHDYYTRHHIVDCSRMRNSSRIRG